MTLYYTGNGNVNIGGCARVERRIYVFYKWGERSIVYVKPKAVKGILEKIAVKKVILNNISGQYIPVYQDTLNSLYNEEELITEYEARVLVQEFIDRQKYLLAKAARECVGNTI